MKAHQAGGRYHQRGRSRPRTSILREWDAYAYRQAYDHAIAHPDDVAEVARRLREYLRDQPDGRYAADAQHYLDWWDKVSVPGQYRVTLRRGEVEPTVGKYLAGGAPDLGVVIEVAGTVYGPSSVIRDSHRPIWDYTFPQPITWKLGDPITIRIIDYDWSASEVLHTPQPGGRPPGDEAPLRDHQAGQGGQDLAGLLLRFHDSHAEPARVAARSTINVRHDQVASQSPNSSKPSTVASRSGIAAMVVLSQSAGCRPEWLAELRTVCQRYGEPPAAAAIADSLFALRLECGPWMIVGVHPQGCDDQGRPGALAFHALFVGAWGYRWASADPFAFAGLLRGDWSSKDRNRTLPAAQWACDQPARISESLDAPVDDPRSAPIVKALTLGRRVVVQSNEPIDDLVRGVWQAVPRSVRRRLSVATWAFDNLNDFDLVALPKLAGTSVDAAALILALDQSCR